MNNNDASVTEQGDMTLYSNVRFISEIMPSLIKCIQDPESRSVENIAATENAISAVTKICKYRREAVNVDEILPHWLTWLPVWEDEDEAVHIYGYLCDLVEM